MLSYLLRPRFLRDSATDQASGPAAETQPTASTIPAPAAPAAAAIVKAGEKTEADVALELENKKLSTRLAQLEDEKRQLQEALNKPVDVPITVATDQKKTWLEGGSFFH